MNIVIKFLVLFAVIASTSACSSRTGFTPNGTNLHDATVDKEYFAEINIIGGRVITPGNWFPGVIEPEGSGLRIQNCKIPEWKLSDKTRPLYNGNCIQITGIPVLAGILKVNISGSLHSGMFTSPGSFEKSYQIKVVAGKE